MSEPQKPDFKSPYEMEIADTKRARRSKILILSSGVAVGATMLAGAVFAVSQEISEDQVQEQVKEQVKEQGEDQLSPNPESQGQTEETVSPSPEVTNDPAPPPSLDPQGKFTPGYAEGEEGEHVGSDEDHPENIYHEDDGENHSDSESGDDD